MENNIEKSSNPMIPKRIPWITLSNDPDRIVKEQVAAACIGLHPKALYIGIKKSPPPNPIPLKIPVKKLFSVTNLMFYSTILFLNDETSSFSRAG